MPTPIGLFSLAMISAVMFLGAPIPCQPLASYPGRKSPTVGISDNTSKRVAVVTASGRSLPALMCSIDSGKGLKITCTWPPSRSVVAGAPPRYGTWTMSTPAVILNSSPTTCCGVQIGEGRTISKYRKGQIVFSQGDPADAVFYVQKGKVKVAVVSEQGKEAVVAILRAYEICGQGCLSGLPRRRSAFTT